MKEKLFKCLFIESYEVINDTVMIRLQKDTAEILIWRVQCGIHSDLYRWSVLLVWGTPHTESLPEAAYYSWGVCPWPQPDQFRHDDEGTYPQQFWLIPCQIMSRSFVWGNANQGIWQIVKFKKNKCYSQTNWITCIPYGKNRSQRSSTNIVPWFKQ